MILAALLAISQVGMGHDQSPQTHSELGQNLQTDFGETTGSPADQSCEDEAWPAFSGHGFAMIGNESHDLLIHVENLMSLDPMQVQKLMASNKSLDELSNEINVMQGKAIQRGSIKLDGTVYSMVDINLSTPTNNSFTLYANVIEPTSDLTISNETAIAGYISALISSSDDGMVGNGELTINSGPHAGIYRIILDIQPINQCMKTHRGRGGHR